MLAGLTIPTDNIFKFLCILCLSLLLSSVIGIYKVYEFSFEKEMTYTEKLHNASLLKNHMTSDFNLQIDLIDYYKKSLNTIEEDTNFYLGQLVKVFCISFIGFFIFIYLWWISVVNENKNKKWEKIKR